MELQPLIRDKLALTLLASALALAGASCGSKPKVEAKTPDCPNTFSDGNHIQYTNCMRIFLQGSETMVDLCRGTELVHEVIEASDNNGKPYLQTRIQVYRDKKCEDMVITPSDFNEKVGPPAPVTTGVNT